MNAYTIRNHTLRTALFLICAGLFGISQASELDLSTEFHAAAEQAVASIRDKVKIQLDESIQPLFLVDVNLEAAATDMDKVVKQMYEVSRPDTMKNRAD